MLKLKCNRHPKYSGNKSPRASCEACVALYRIRLDAIRDRVQVVTNVKTVKEAQEA
jgi:hypothetical protein